MSRPAQQDFWHLGHRRQSRGRATQGGERGGRVSATGTEPAGVGGLSALGCGSVRGAGGGIKEGLAAPRRSQDASRPGWACCELQMAASGLSPLPRTEHVRVASRVRPWQLLSRWGGGRGWGLGGWGWGPGAGPLADLPVSPAPKGPPREWGPPASWPPYSCVERGPGCQEDGAPRGRKYWTRLVSAAGQLFCRVCASKLTPVLI